jgi:signal transduction histidine kinase
MPSSEFQADIESIARIAAIPTILDVIRQTTGMGFVAVARVTESRWVACSVLDDIDFGLSPGGELEIDTTICRDIREVRQTVAIDHVDEDRTYMGHQTPTMYGFQSYVSTPIILADGRFFGTLCAIDPKPAHVNNSKTIGMFKLFAELIGRQLDTDEDHAATEERLQEELRTSVVREQFIAVLGHDLRNPVAAVAAGTNILLRTASDEKSRSILAMMHKSTERMSSLISNVMDFARGRLGGGMIVERTTRTPLDEVLRQIVDELQLIWPDRRIDLEMKLDHVVRFDDARIGQLFSNLLSNALTHGAENGPITVSASTSGDAFHLAVANRGEPIPADAIPRLFQPFTRTENGLGSDGLGLGLYIAAQIAEAHHGTLSVTSTPDETRFTLRMPLE